MNSLIKEKILNSDQVFGGFRWFSVVFGSFRWFSGFINGRTTRAILSVSVGDQFENSHTTGNDGCDWSLTGRENNKNITLESALAVVIGDTLICGIAMAADSDKPQTQSNTPITAITISTGLHAKAGS